jgi:plasmid maintenance system antidote protein VapI
VKTQPPHGLALARYLGTQDWLKLQARFDLETARQAGNADIAAIKPRKPPSTIG